MAELLLLRRIPIAPRHLTSETNFSQVEDQCVSIFGSQVDLPGPIRRQLHEYAATTYELEQDSDTRANILEVAMQIVKDINVFSELRLKPQNTIETMVVSAGHFIEEAVDKGKPMVVVCPYLYESLTRQKVVSRFRAIIPEVNTDILYQRKSLFALVEEWKYATKLLAPEKQKELIQGFSAKANTPNGYGWDAFAIALGYFSEYSFDELEKLAISPEAKNFLNDIFPRDKSIESFRAVEEVSKIYEEYFPKAVFSRNVRYKVPTVYGIDFGSVLYEWLEGKSVEEWTRERVVEMFQRVGYLMKYRPIDVFATELERVPFERNIFNQETTRKVIDRIYSFINGHEFDPDFVPSLMSIQQEVVVA